MATLYFGTTLINQTEANVATVVESLTKAEYEALAVKDPNTLYVLTDVVDDNVTREEMNAAIAAIPTPDVSGQISEHNLDVYAHTDIRREINAKAPMYTYGTEDLVAGTTPLAAGTLHFVYEGSDSTSTTVSTFTFTIDEGVGGGSPITYTAEVGMTWSDFIYSSYNTDNISVNTVNGQTMLLLDGLVIMTNNGDTFVLPTDVIDTSLTYRLYI